MKLTKSQLKRILREEISNFLKEDPAAAASAGFFTGDEEDEEAAVLNAEGQGEPRTTYRGKVRNKKTGRIGMVSNIKKGNVTVAYHIHDEKEPRSETLPASAFEIMPGKGR